MKILDALNVQLFLQYKLKLNYVRKSSFSISSNNNLYTFSTVEDNYMTNYDIKKSKFICYVHQSQNIDNALVFLNKIKDIRATHNCWAYKSADGSHRYSDDGEPSGTAGKPILQAIESDGLVDCMVVVIRYYGGIKLGTGGLARAYATSAKEAIKKIAKIKLVKTIDLVILIKYELIGILYQVLRSKLVDIDKYRITERFLDLESKIFTNANDNEIINVIETIIRCPEDLIKSITDVLNDQTNGQVIVKKLSDYN